MKARVRRLLRAVRSLTRAPAEPLRAQRQRDTDRRGLPLEDPGSARVVRASVDWLCRAQDRSASKDGGVARSFSLLHGWGASYPETTGYIIPTLLDCAKRAIRPDLRERARRMLDWLVRIQMPSGAFQGGRIDSVPVVPVAFNTGQIVLGLAAGEREFGGYREALRRAADWLVEVQDADGCWREGRSPFTHDGEKTYDTHIAWGLLEADGVLPGRGYAEAALANVRWAIGHQRDNGWLDHCCLGEPSEPLTHTIAYAWRGILEAHRYRRDPKLLQSAISIGRGVVGAMRDDGFLSGQLGPNWTPLAAWSCLTGSAQVAACLAILSSETGEAGYREASARANGYVRRTVCTSGDADVVGAVRGSFPIDGAYSRYEYPNWAAKFLIDSLLMELDASVGPSAVRAAGAAFP